MFKVFKNLVITIQNNANLLMVYKIITIIINNIILLKVLTLKKVQVLIYKIIRKKEKEEPKLIISIIKTIVIIMC